MGAIILHAFLLMAVLYWIPIRLWYLRWGVSDRELSRPMPGDKAVSNPTYLATAAVTIEAPPEYMWPRLLQMGNGRGGLYSYDWLEVWQFALVPVSRRETRLISRNQARVPRSIPSFLFMLEPAAFLMTRKMLLGITRRAEALCRESASAPVPLLPSVRV